MALEGNRPPSGLKASSGQFLGQFRILTRSGPVSLVLSTAEPGVRPVLSVLLPPAHPLGDVLSPCSQCRPWSRAFTTDHLHPGRAAVTNPSSRSRGAVTSPLGERAEGAQVGGRPPPSISPGLPSPRPCRAGGQGGGDTGPRLSALTPRSLPPARRLSAPGMRRPHPAHASCTALPPPACLGSAAAPCPVYEILSLLCFLMGK